MTTDSICPESGQSGPRASFIAGAVKCGFTEVQASWLWTAIPFHPLVEEWKDARSREVVTEYYAQSRCGVYLGGEQPAPIRCDIRGQHQEHVGLKDGGEQVLWPS